MISRLSTLLISVLFAGLAASADEPIRCSATAHECELEIRQMLSGRRYLGAVVSDLNPGLVIKTVNTDGPAIRAGLRVADRVIAINGRAMLYSGLRDFKQALADVKDSGVVILIIQRQGAYRKVDLRLEPYPKAQIDKIVAAHLAQSHTTASTSTAGSQQ